MGRNNNHALGGSGVRLEVAPNFTGIINQNREIVRNWYQIFIHNIHLLNLKLLKWDKSSRLQEKMTDWLKTLDRNPRDVSIIFSVNDFLINTSEHFRQVCAQ